MNYLCSRVQRIAAESAAATVLNDALSASDQIAAAESSNAVGIVSGLGGRQDCARSRLEAAVGSFA